MLSSVNLFGASLGPSSARSTGVETRRARPRAVGYGEIAVAPRPLRR